MLGRVLEVIAENDLILATGHLAWQEQMVVVKRAKGLGVNRILVNHPTLFRISMPLVFYVKVNSLVSPLKFPR